MSTPTFSVIIPLYNKEAEVAATLRSALEQSLRPLEVIVVDDGSTDGSADIVAAFRSPLVRLIRQPNAGVSAARNRAIAEARGEYVAMLDADDLWRTGFLAEIAAMIERWPGCGLYATAFDIVSGEGLVPGRTPDERGPVDDFFTRSMSCYVAIPSASVIPRAHSRTPPRLSRKHNFIRIQKGAVAFCNSSLFCFAIYPKNLSKFWKINLKAFSHKSGKLCYNHNYGRGWGCAALTENNEEGGEPYGTVPLQALWCDQKRR